MEVVHERCAGLDVHKRTVVACVRTARGQETRTFGTTTEALQDLGGWLAAERVTHVAMESTGVFWQPIYNLLEGSGLEVLVANARHVKAVPGRKTDVKDAEWLAELLRHGLVRGSVILDRAGRELRELVRYRTTVIRQRAQVVNRIQKVLEGANVKLSAVLSDIVGASGRAMLEALVEGSATPEAVADLAVGRLRLKRPQLLAALRGSLGPHQRLVLGSQLRQLDFYEAEVSQLDAEIIRRMHGWEADLERLDSIPGINRRTAEVLLAEIGSDWSRFPTSSQAASWARLCPGNNESAGKRRTGRTGGGNPWLRSALVEAAWGAAHTRHTYLATHFRRIAARRGAKRASMALAHTLLVIAYQVMHDGTMYQDLGETYLDERDRTHVLRRSIKRLERLGYKVTIEAA
jgi:transposase